MAPVPEVLQQTTPFTPTPNSPIYISLESKAPTLYRIAVPLAVLFVICFAMELIENLWVICLICELLLLKTHCFQKQWKLLIRSLENYKMY